MKREIISLLVLLLVLYPLNAAEAVNLTGHVRYLSKDIGPRPAGSPAEEEAADYLVAQFRRYGLKTEVQEFKYYSLRSGDVKTSRNVIGTIEGLSEREVVICADLDTPRDTLTSTHVEGANDDATGLAVLIGLAERYSKRKPLYTVRLIAFGAGEDPFTFPLFTPDRTSLEPDSYHQIVYIPYLVGSRYHVLSHQDTLKSTAAVISVEAAGLGTPCVVSGDYYRENSRVFTDFILLSAMIDGINARKIEFMAMNMTVAGEVPISHVYLPFSIAGVPSTFITCMRDPTDSPVHTEREIPGYLSVDDTYENLLKFSGGEEKLNTHLNMMVNLTGGVIDRLPPLDFMIRMTGQ